MTTKIPQYYFLVMLIAVAATLCFFIFRPFLVVLVFAIIFAVVLQPLHRHLLRYLPRSPGLAAGGTILVAFVCILVPLTFIGLQIVREAQSLLQADPGASTLFQNVHDFTAGYAPGLVVPADLSASIDQYGKNALAWVVNNLGGALESLAQLLLNLFVFLMALYYLLRDGLRLKEAVIQTSPLSDADDEIVFTRLEGAVNSVIRGSLVVALLQGMLSTLGFVIFGVPNSVLWGVVAAMASLVPGVGTSLVLMPAVAYLFIIGATVPAIGLLIWSVFAVGMIDNFLGPRLLGKGMKLHPLIVLLSVFGGLAYFGAVGLFIGPLCVSLLYALLSIFQHVSVSAA